MAWKQGPLPPDTWGWGAVTTAESNGGAFFFADFNGNFVLTYPGSQTFYSSDILMYDNSITEPPVSNEGKCQMSNTLNAYPTDLTTPAGILLTRFGSTPASASAQVHACYQIIGVGLGNSYPDGPSPVPTPALKDIWDRPDGMKAYQKFTDEQVKACLEEACKMHGKIGDWFKTVQGQMLLQIAMSLIPTVLALL